MMRKILPHWKKVEKSVAKISSGKLTPGSGSHRNKGDIQTNEYLIEVKTTNKNSFSIKSSVLEKVSREAKSAGKIPALCFSMGNGKKWFAMPINFVFGGDDEAIR